MFIYKDRLLAVAYSYIFLARGEGKRFNKFSWGQRAENGDLGAVAPQSGVPLNLQMGETVLWLGWYGCIFHGTTDSSRLCQNLGILGGRVGQPDPYPPRYVTVNELQSSGSFWRRLYLEITGPYYWGIPNKIVMHRLTVWCRDFLLNFSTSCI
jgi:hypothetical protein